MLSSFLDTAGQMRTLDEAAIRDGVRTEVIPLNLIDGKRKRVKD